MHEYSLLRRVLLCLLVFGAGAGIFSQVGNASYSSTSSTWPDQGSRWQRFELSGSDLQAVDAVDANTLWAVGTDGLLAHWDGSNWAAYDNSKLGAPDFTGVDVLSADAAWAVASRNLVARWNGTAWTAEASNTGSANMNDISMVSMTDGWIVGGTTNSPVLARYNGSTWQQVNNAGVSRPLFSVDAVDSNNVWAVGGRFGPQFVGEVVRWNGTAWSQALSLSSILYAVDMLDATYGWAVGTSSALWQWDGTSWTQATPPSPGDTVYDVVVNSRTDAWAVTSDSTPVWHWDGTSWTAMPAPQTAGLLGIKMLSANEGWAVGPRSTIYRWDGTSWTVFTSRWTTGGYAAVDFLSPDDGWAVGANDPGVPIYGLQHWNGTTWEGFHPPVNQHLLTDVDMVATDAVWALGADGYIFRWNGTTWTLDPGPGFSVYAISMVSATDGWAVGTNGGIAHYDGSLWTSYPSPVTSDLWAIDMVDAGEGWAGGIGFLIHYQDGAWTEVDPGISNSVDSIHMLSRDEGWAVGGGGLILHYQHGTWTPQSSPIPSALLQSVHMISPAEGWTVGANSSIFGPAVVLHYLNGTWSSVIQPTGLPLRDVFAFDADEAWIVGDSPGVLLRYGNKASITPTPAVTATPGATGTATASPQPTTSTATASPIPPTATLPVATPTPCLLSFSDVPITNTFYASIRCLACREIISGYSDGTFRPNNEVTRGQLAKIVSNAAGYTESPDPQIFEDVPPSDTFYQWVNRLARRGHMSGYPCGGVGEPCTTGMPYFRPFANATRGQTSKIVSNAAGYSEIPTDQTFEDVPPTHTFYMEVQRLASRNIMQGYPCGGPGEPCVTGRPYFRPQNNVTRGQSAKIVANTFYPGCNPNARP